MSEIRLSRVSQCPDQSINNSSSLLPLVQQNKKTQRTLTVMYVIIGTLLGTLMRLLLTTTYIPYFQRISYDLHLNLLALFLQGLSYSEDPNKQFQALYDIGFCGSMTSWASWAITFEIKDRSVVFTDAALNVLVTFALYNFFYQFGRSFSQCLGRMQKIGISLNDNVTFLVQLSLIALFYILNIGLNELVLERTQDSLVWEVSLVIAPIASLIRYGLLRLNQNAWIPLGTLIPNCVSVVLSTLYYSIGQDNTLLMILQMGFSENLGNLAQFIAEVHRFKKMSHVWIYGGISLGLSWILCFYSSLID